MRSALCAQLSAHVGSCTDVFSPPLVSGCPGLPCHGLALHACALRAQRAASASAGNGIECSHGQFCSSPHDHRLVWPIRFQSQPDCPTAPMPLLCPRLRCTLTELRLWSDSVRRGDPLPTCSCPSQQGAGHCPCLDLKGQRQLHLLVPRLYWQQRCAAFPRTWHLAHHHHRPRHHDSLALTLTLTLTRRAPSACRRTRWRRRLRSSSGARPCGGRGGARRGAPRGLPATPTLAQP